MSDRTEEQELGEQASRAPLPAAQALAADAPLKGGQLGITALALALGTFMQVLDSTIANVSLPTISGNLGVSSDQGTWVITAFAVANGIGVPLTGWLMGRYGVVRTFVVSVLLFTIASFLKYHVSTLNALEHSRKTRNVVFLDDMDSSKERRYPLGIVAG